MRLSLCMCICFSPSPSPSPCVCVCPYALVHAYACVCVCVRKRQHIKLVGHWTHRLVAVGGHCHCRHVHGPCHWPEQCGKSHFLIWLLSCKNIKSALRKSRLFFTRISDILRSTTDTLTHAWPPSRHTHSAPHMPNTHTTHTHTSLPMSPIPETRHKLKSNLMLQLPSLQQQQRPEHS